MSLSGVKPHHLSSSMDGQVLVPKYRHLANQDASALMGVAYTIFNCKYAYVFLIPTIIKMKFLGSSNFGFFRKGIKMCLILFFIHNMYCRFEDPSMW